MGGRSGRAGHLAPRGRDIERPSLLHLCPSLFYSKGKSCDERPVRKVGQRRDNPSRGCPDTSERTAGLSVRPGQEGEVP